MGADNKITIFINVDSKGCIKSADISERTNEDFTEIIPGNINVKCKECCGDIFVELYSSINDKNHQIKHEFRYIESEQIDVVFDEQTIKEEMYSSNEDSRYDFSQNTEIEIFENVELKDGKVKKKYSKRGSTAKKKEKTRKNREEVKNEEDNECDVKPENSDSTKPKLKHYQCPICNLVFTSKFGIRYHKFNCPKGKPLNCEKCSKPFTVVRQLVLHSKICGQPLSTCANCNYEFTKPDFVKHKKVCFPGKLLECKKCTKIFPTTASMKIHTLKCRPERMGKSPSCTVCNKTFNSWGYAKTHMETVHFNIAETCVCQICGKVVRKAELSKHLSRHKPVVPYECDMCAHKANSKRSIMDHIILKHVSDYEFIYCYECSPPKKFLETKKLEEHKFCHSTVKTVPCTECSRLFKTKKDLRDHFSRIHKPLDLKKKYICEFPGCQFVTTSKGGMRQHTFVHKDDSEKPFHCSYCNKGYTNKHQVKHHELSHTGEKPFGCSTCGKSFKAKDALKVHVRLHTGEKPYECAICQQRFSDRGCYRSHILAHEKQLNVTLSTSVKSFVKN